MAGHLGAIDIDHWPNIDHRSETMSPVFQGFPAAASVEQAILLAQLQILRRINAQRKLP
jgi:hypothetical protein